MSEFIEFLIEWLYSIILFLSSLILCIVLFGILVSIISACGVHAFQSIRGLL